MNADDAHVPGDLESLITWWRGRMRRNWDAVFAIIGDPGTGKSDLALQIGSDLQAPVPLNVVEQVVFKPADVPHVARRLPKFRYIQSDESSRAGGNKRRAMSKENVANMEYLDTCRANNQAVCFIAPSWDHLDTPIQERAQWVLEVRGRGHGVAYEVIKRGKPDNRYYYLKERWPWTAESTEKLAPLVWASYLKAKDDFLAGRLSEGRARTLALEDQMKKAIVGVLRERGGQEVAAVGKA